MGMRELNGVFTQRFNRTYQLMEHVFPGRHKAILVQESYLLELARYVVPNPLRAPGSIGGRLPMEHSRISRIVRAVPQRGGGARVKV
jgi:hypothetical protein